MRLSFLLLPVLVSLSGCGPGDGDGPAPPGGEVAEAEGNPSLPGFPLEFTGADGQTLVFREPPSRIVSPLPSATRTLQALGAQGLLVGRTDFDTIGGVQGLVSVGGGLNPNLEALVGLEPDLVIRFAGESDQSTPTRLDEMGIRHISFRPDRMTDVRDLVQGLGLLTDRSAQAHALLAEMDATLREIEEKLLGRPLVRVAYVLGGNPPWVAGPETFIHELLAAAGGENVFQDLEGLYGPVSMEEFLVRDIHVLLVPMGAELSLPFADLPVVRVSPTLELPGPDLAQGVRDLAKILHPEAFR